jgi:Ca2+/Na+ antiporter
MPIYKIEFDIVSLIICCIAFIVFHKQKQMNTNRNTLFYTIIIFISLSAVFSLLNSLALNRLATSSIYFAYITNILYLAFHTHVPFLFCIYIFILTEYRLPNRTVRILFALLFVSLRFRRPATDFSRLSLVCLLLSARLLLRCRRGILARRLL